MTTFQDPPPQSRRSARESERGDPRDALVTGDSLSPPEQTAPQSYQPTGPQPPASTNPQSLDDELLSRSGRRAREAAQQGLYHVAPTQPAPAPASAPSAPVAPAPSPPPAPAASTDPQAAPQYRVRDFSPEGRATGRRAAPPPLIEPGSSAPTAPSDLDYRTQAAPPASSFAPAPTGPAQPAPAQPAPAQQAPVQQAPVQPQPQQTPVQPQQAPAQPTHQTLSRRELRQKLAEESGASLLSGPQPPFSTTSAEPAYPTGPQNPSLVTGAQNPSLVTGAQNAAYATGPQNPSLVTGSLPPLSQVPPPFSPPPPSAASSPFPQAAPPAAPAASMSSAAADFEALTRSGALAPPTAAQRVTDVNDAGIYDTVTPSFIEPELEQTGGWTPPVGHWSRQADLDDETQPFENTVTREVGGGNVATTTSALVLPEMPRPNPFPTALNGTGEILLTGSIDLPRSLSSVGGDSRHFDSGDVDLMFDEERQVPATDSSPVSAIRAVSTHTSARGVIGSANKPHGNRMLTVLLVIAATMAVGVVGLLIAGISGQIF